MSSSPTQHPLLYLLQLLSVNHLLNAAFNTAGACALSKCALASAPLTCPLSTVNFLKSELNRPWKGGTDGYILGGNYQPLPPCEKKKTEEKQVKVLQTGQLMRLTCSCMGSLAKSSNQSAGKGPSGAPTARLTESQVSTAIRGWFLASLHIRLRKIYINAHFQLACY